MYALTQKLINNSGVTAATHPVLVSLLELGAQPSTAKGGKPGAEITRLCRQWRKVGKAFRRCLQFKVSDADLLASPLEGLSFGPETGWRITAPDLLQYRALVAQALDAAADMKGKTLPAFKVGSIAELRIAQRSNRIRPFDASPLDQGKVETSLLPGRRLVVSYPIHGRRVFTALQADECGRVHALAHEKTRRAAAAAATLPDK